MITIRVKPVVIMGEAAIAIVAAVLVYQSSVCIANARIDARDHQPFTGVAQIPDRGRLHMSNIGFYPFAFCFDQALVFFWFVQDVGFSSPDGSYTRHILQSGEHNFAGVLDKHGVLDPEGFIRNTGIGKISTHRCLRFLCRGFQGFIDIPTPVRPGHLSGI